ncbi:hypothetical protein CHS0354_039688 [Potamilus streckersoni]|uniref:Uncharacterized protein n=1 Tax=Potamilus streckersoni TaxID=2493646 RepID=A0AAE0SYX4_9BIVA|nr:hypothetical protein CHS0354_039688 [Potamilus streckersoni]
MDMMKIKIILTVYVLISGFALMPLVSGRCDHDMLSKCINTFSSSFRGFVAQQDIISTMKMFCRSDVHSAVICIVQGSANCFDGTSYSSLSSLLRIVNAGTLQEHCNVLSKIPGDALNCLKNALNMSGTQIRQCVISASANVFNSLIHTVIQALSLCSLNESRQKCKDHAIAETYPNQTADRYEHFESKNKFTSYPKRTNDPSEYIESTNTFNSYSSAGKTQFTSILTAACFTILKLVHD